MSKPLWQQSLERQYPVTILQKIAAAGLSREVQHLLTSSSFAILSAQNGSLNLTQDGRATNNQADAQLRNDLQQMGYGFIRQVGLFEDLELKVKLPEKSLLIPNIDEQSTLSLAKKYQQQAYIWGNNGYFVLKRTDGVMLDEGNVAERFHQLLGDQEAQESQGFTEVKGRRWTLAPRLTPNTIEPDKISAVFVIYDIPKASYLNGLHKIGSDFTVPPGDALHVWLPLSGNI